MSDGMLKDILVIERQIEQELADQRKQADAWLAEQKAAIDRQIETELEQAENRASSSRETRCQSARNAGARWMREERQAAARLGHLSDNVLSRAVKKHLPEIFDGAGHDHPDG